jgi:hypothetical protein
LWAVVAALCFLLTRFSDPRNLVCCEVQRKANSTVTVLSASMTCLVLINVYIYIYIVVMNVGKSIDRDIIYFAFQHIF